VSADDWRHDRALDARGLNCPLPVLKARKALAGMAAGTRLLVEATDPLAAIDFPNFCREAGHRLLAADRGERLLRFLIEKANGSA
jgi:tRNA 2-thiouridine synthesizing protein A